MIGQDVGQSNQEIPTSYLYFRSEAEPVYFDIKYDEESQLKTETCVVLGIVRQG
jgi:hypothetical protein